MPYASAKQSSFLHSQKPNIAEKFDKEIKVKQVEAIKRKMKGK